MRDIRFIRIIRRAPVALITMIALLVGPETRLIWTHELGTRVRGWGAIAIIAPIKSYEASGRSDELLTWIERERER